MYCINWLVNSLINIVLFIKHKNYFDAVDGIDEVGKIKSVIIWTKYVVVSTIKGQHHENNSVGISMLKGPKRFDKLRGDKVFFHPPAPPPPRKKARLSF